MTNNRSGSVPWESSYRGLMKQCLVCGREVVSKRKDAVFCKDSACRKKAHQQRKEQAAKLPHRVLGNKASVVVTFPDGSRWLLELTPLQGNESAGLPSLTQVSAAIVENGSGSVPTQTAALSVVGAASPSAAGVPAISSDQIPQAAASGPASQLTSTESRTTAVPSPDVPTQEVIQAASISAVPTSANPSAVPRAELRTVELFFTDEGGRRITFRNAVQDRGFGRWRIRGHARAVLGFGPKDGYGLGGSPGRWGHYYAEKSPSEFGFDSDLAVLFIDEEADLVCIADVRLLKEALGEEWRARLRELAKDKG